MNLEDVERLLRDRLDAIGPAPRAVLQHVLMLPDHEQPAGLVSCTVIPEHRRSHNS